MCYLHRWVLVASLLAVNGFPDRVPEQSSPTLARHSRTLAVIGPPQLRPPTSEKLSSSPMRNSDAQRAAFRQDVAAAKRQVAVQAGGRAMPYQRDARSTGLNQHAVSSPAPAQQAAVVDSTAPETDPSLSQRFILLSPVL